MLMSGKYQAGKSSTSGTHYMGCGAESHRRRNDFHGKWQTEGLQADRTGGGQNQRFPAIWWDYQAGTRRRHELSGFGRHRAGVANGEITTGEASKTTQTIQETGSVSTTETKEKLTGTTGEVGVFSNPEQQFGGKSIFNKERYLPLVYTPFMISHYCCQVMKKSPMKKFQSANKLVPFLGTLAEESRIRKQAWIRHGCNSFDSKKPSSQPLSFWTEQDILQYIVEYGLEIAQVYGEVVAVGKDGEQYDPKCVMCKNCTYKTTGAERTGCIFCAFGFHNEKGETRFQRIARTHPRQYEYALGGGQWVDNPHYVEGAPEYDGEWKNWNPKKIWVPSKEGLGMKVVFDMVNEIYGKEFYRYE